MAIILPGTGLSVATEDIAGDDYQHVKIVHGVVGVATLVSAADPLPVVSSSAVNETLLYRYLDTVGNGSGNKNANGNYAVPTQFFIAPPPNEVYHIERMIVSIEDTSGMQASEYGNTGSALANGVLVEKRQGASTLLLNLVDGEAITTNARWGSQCYDVDLKTWGAGNELLLVRWTFGKTGGALRLDGNNSERLSVILEDDLTGLISHQFMCQGYVV